MKRLLSIMLVLMLVLSMTATAFAADKATTPEVYLSKTYNDPIGHAATFSFASEEITTGGPILTINPIDFSDADHGGTKFSQLVFNEPTNGKTQPGTYVYRVTETEYGSGVVDKTHQKMTMSQAVYRVTVGVQILNGVYTISDVIVTKETNDDGSTAGGGKVDTSKTDANTFKFVNTYAEEAGWEGDYTNDGSLKISKTVSSDDSTPDTNQEFTFKLKCNLPAGVNPFTITVTHSGGKTVNYNATKETEFTLRHGESLVIKGLPVGTVVNVTEVGTPNYKASSDIIMNGGTPTSQTAGNGADLVIDNQELGSRTNSVAVTNTYNYVAPTGVILNVLPYVLMVAIAGGMIVLFTAMKRRKAQDNNED